MKNEEKAQNIIGCSRDNCCECGGSLSVDNGCVEFQHIMQMAEWKDGQYAEARELLRLCYNTILGITSLDTPEEIAKARKSHDSSLIKRIELFMYNNQ